MIFLTVGTVDPFDRLVEAVDAWVEKSGHTERIFAQIGTGGAYRPKHLDYREFLSPTDYREAVMNARFIVSHAGMGSLITALEFEKPIIIFPRRASLGEQRNEHQLATAQRFRKSILIQPAETVEQLHELLDGARVESEVTVARISSGTEWRPDRSLIEFVQDFVEGARRPSEQSVGSRTVLRTQS